MLRYELGFYFRRPTITGNYQDLLNPVIGTSYADYSKRWQKPGDEQLTNIPSLVYPANSRRTTFYQYSEVLIQNGSNIRVQDVRLSYDFTSLLKHTAFSSLQVYSYANNLGVLWHANKYGLDPDNFNQSYPVPLSISFGVQATLK